MAHSFIDKTRVDAILEAFCLDFPPEQNSIVAVVTGPSPDQYDMWGKPPLEIRNWGLHVHVDYSDASQCNLPIEYHGVPVMVFFNLDLMQ
jgi:hypothetical protein